MSDIAVLNSKFVKSGNIQAPFSLDADIINVNVVHQVVKATLAGKRQGTVVVKNLGVKKVLDVLVKDLVALS